MNALSPSRPLVRLAAMLAALLFTTPFPALGQDDWVSYTDETSTRLVADAAVGSADVQEKDIVVGDVDQDGDPDALIARKVPFSTPGGQRNVLLVNENGVLTDRTATLAPDMLDLTDDRDIVLVDVNNDTWLDAVTVTTFGEQPRVYMNLGENAGVWQGFDYQASDNRLPTFVPGPKFCAVGFGDVSGDQRPDLYFVDYDNDLEDRLLINDGNGFFTDETASRMTPEMADSVFGTDAHILDINGDGFNDIVKDNASGSATPPPGFDSAVQVIYNDGTGNFDFMDAPYSLAPYMVEPGDFDGNGRMDLYVVDDSQDAYLLNTGNDAQNHALFQTHTVTGSPNTAGFGGNTKVHDLDNDGRLDILIADVDTDIPGCNREMVILRGQGTLPNITYSDPFAGASRPWLPSGTFDLEALDIDGDGVLDLLLGTCDGLEIHMGTIPPIFGDGFESGDLSAWSGSAG